LIKAMNRAFDVEEQRPFWHRYLLAIGLTLLAGTAMIAAFALYVVGQVVADDAARRLGLSGVIWDVLPVLRLPVVIALVFGAVAVLYRLGPAMRLPFRWILPGAALFAVGWLLATFLFGLYVTEFSSYGSTYGALAGVAILLIWFYLSAFILLFGVEVNGVLSEWQDPEEVARQRAISQGH
jgi:membrane protein